ncbi:MAG: BrnT family toxin [Elusimicrobia bacterium]|nr:BrnT family toxin [Elusimicrobiota bacterium]
MDKRFGSFIWDIEKENSNVEKHGIDFFTALKVFKDPKRKIFIDSKHSEKEERYFCVGKAGDKILTVRFTYRAGIIRVFGAGSWRKGVRYYEKD